MWKVVMAKPKHETVKPGEVIDASQANVDGDRVVKVEGTDATVVIADRLDPQDQVFPE